MYVVYYEVHTHNVCSMLWSSYTQWSLSVNMGCVSKKNHERCFIFVCPFLFFFYLSKSEDVGKVDVIQNLSFNFKRKSLNVKRRWLSRMQGQKLKCELKSILKKKHSSLFPFLNNFILIFYFEKISSSPFQILTCQDQKSVCPPKATFFPRDIFKVKRGGPVLYLLPI